MNVLVIGAGDVGFMISRRLSEEGMNVFVVEKDEAKASKISQMLDVKVVLGSGASLKTLKEAGLEHTEMLIAVADLDEVNLVASFIAGAFANIPTKIVRIRGQEYNVAKKIFQKDYLDIDFIINPEQEAASTIDLLLEIPGSLDVIQVADGRVQLGGFKMGNGSPVVNRPLKDVTAEAVGVNFLIASILRHDKLLIPRGKDHILPGDRVYVVLDKDNNKDVLSFMGLREKPAHNVMIYGGSITGEMLARRLERKGINVKLIEPDEGRCIILSETLSRTTVLNSPTVDKEMLSSERISDMDAFITTSDDEEANILSALLAKRMGNPHVIALVNNMDYVSLVSDIGVDAVINPRIVAVSRILQFIRKGKIFSITSLSDIDAEVIEVEAMETSDLVDRPIKNINWPNGAIIAGIIRRGQGRVIFPSGSTVIDPGDRVVIFANKRVIPKIEKILSVKPDYF
ncbi:MAG: Trk system potassium transporter TrkA [Thermodesulfobacteriota bacterium]|nr:Trk system potassium transporter TrkA [Thermodesulfobacteriota bacterium]